MKILERFSVPLCLIILELTIIHAQTDEYNEEICSPVTESYGPLPPPVPESFIMKYETVDLERAFAFWDEIYFDSLNLRAKYKTVHQGKEYHYIFDYDTEQILSYVVFHPGVSAENDPESLETCKATSMEDDPLHLLFGYRFANLDGNKRSRMYDSFDVLQFGGNYRYAFNQSMIIDDRGMPADKYLGCIFMSSPKATFEKLFYWSGKTVIPASTPAQVPVKIETYGEIRMYPNQDGKGETVDVWNIQNIPWFEGNPTFDESVFQVPRGMYCKDYRASRNLPNMPKFFSWRLELTTILRDKDGVMLDVGVKQYNEMWYDSVDNMARVDFTVDMGSGFEIFEYMGEVPVSGVYDVSEGVAYITNKLSGECVPFKIDYDFFLLSKESKTKLAPPDQILGLNFNKLEYKGKNFARNIHCNVWASSLGNESFVEAYFATDGWHTDSDEDEEYDYPVRFTEMSFINEKGQKQEYVTEANIFKYKATKPLPSVYDISGCRNTQNQNYYFFSIAQNAKEYSKNLHKFIQAARASIKDYSKIGSLLRVQDVDVTVPSVRRNVMVSFSLMDSPQLYGSSSKLPGISLESAEANLKRAIDNGDFQIVVVLDSQRGAQIIRALPGSLNKAIPQADPKFDSDSSQSDSNTEDSMKYSYPLDERKDILQVPDFMLSDSKDNTEGYSSGSLGGLAVGMLIVGIILGIGLMYFYLKKYGQQEIGHGIIMQDRK